eukprot:TRINITY_DN18336_c0_g1_i1.p1 TRINITY_DN18336_c0_g1~~TRINITY_DN18336_c0_g1_i1.p1  ORF type:complete len:207 (+),score=88.99 TRINITY_DN18336_c0_g1_i1:106-726(+)
MPNAASAQGLQEQLTTEGIDLSTVNEYLLAKEDGELSFAELVKYQQGTSFSRAQVQKLYRRWRVLGKGKASATAAEVAEALPHTLRESFVLDRMLGSVAEDGVIRFAGFVRLMAPFEQGCDPALQHELLFHLYDTDGDGKVSPADLKAYLEQQFAAINLTPAPEVYDQIINQTFAALDLDRDGYLLPRDLNAAAGESVEQMVLAFS